MPDSDFRHEWRACDTGNVFQLVNNARIREYNALLEDLAQEKGCVYLDVASAVSDETGCLRSDWTFDGVHLNPAGCQAWLQYLKEHPVDG